MNFETFKSYALALNPELKSFGLYLNVLYAQAVHETANFKSELYLRTHNMYGMKQALKRDQSGFTCEFDDNGYAIYDTPSYSIADRIDLDDNFNRLTPLISFNSALLYIVSVQNSGYAEDKNYVPKWTTLFRNIFKIVPSTQVERINLQVAEASIGSGSGSLDKYKKQIMENMEHPEEAKTVSTTNIVLWSLALALAIFLYFRLKKSFRNKQ